MSTQRRARPQPASLTVPQRFHREAYALVRAVWRYAAAGTTRPGFVAREVASATRRHKGTAAAIVVTATLALVMLGGALLLRSQIDDLKGAWYDKTQVAVYLTQDATDAQVAEIGEALENDAAVTRVWFEDHQLAFENFTDQFSGSPELVAEVTPDQMPRSYRLQLADPTNGAEVVAGTVGLPGVRQVVDEHAQLSTLFDVLGGFQKASLILAIIQSFAAIVLISNMVRSTLAARTEELEVGRVMGASRSQLALPFLAEVATYGCVGTIAATGMLALAKYELIDQRLATSGVLSGVIGYVGWDAVWAAVPWLALSGVGLPLLVTAAALRRHLHT